MANNIVEEFFISIGIDTKKVKKEAGEVDKILDKLVNKKRKGVSDEIKLKQKAYKLQKSSEVDNFKHFLKIEKGKQKAIKATQDASGGRVRRAQGMVSGMRDRGDLRNVGKLQGKGLLDPKFNSMLDKAAIQGNIKEVHNLKRALKQATLATRSQARASKKLSTVQKGLNDSTRNMIRSYASVFALFQGTVAIKRVGQDFESLRASMLVVSTSEEDAGKKMAFVRKEAFRLGVDLKTAAKAYLALSASSSDALGEDGVKGLFTSVMSISRAFGMSMDDTKGTFKA